MAQERVHLDEALTERRLKWAFAHRHWTKNMWRRKAMWGDEVTIEREGGEGKSGYLDILKRSGIRTMLRKLLGGERGRLAK